MQPYNQLTIDLSAVRKNIETIKKRLPSCQRVMPMLKAGAYGTESSALASYLTTMQVEIVGVSHVAEGVSLRIKGCELSIFVIYAAPFEAKTVVDYNLEVSVSNLDLCLALNHEAAKVGKMVKVHLDINTGMHRFGVKPQEALELALEIKKLPFLVLEGVMTHFIAAENPSEDMTTQHQIFLFKEVVNSLKEKEIHPPWIHAANSSGAIRFPLAFCNMVRIGAALFGLPSSSYEKEHVQLHPALTLESCIVGINKCLKGETVGYAKGYTVGRELEMIAILPLGYYDGLHLNTSGKGYVLIHGKKAPYVGRICMDFMMVDVTAIPEAKIGDPVLLFGQNEKKETLLIEDVAAFSNTNIREIVTSLGPRISRRFINDQPELIPLRSLYKNEASPQAVVL